MSRITTKDTEADLATRSNRRSRPVFYPAKRTW
jgi:hypothetical protein